MTLKSLPFALMTPERIRAIQEPSHVYTDSRVTRRVSTAAFVLCAAAAMSAQSAEVKLVPKQSDAPSISVQGSSSEQPLAQRPDTHKTMVVLDASGSMWAKIDATSKIEIARDVVSTVLETWPESEHLGLVAYGHRKKGDCGDIETLIRPDKLDVARFAETIKGINPKGKTPMSDAVVLAAEELKHTENQATVILITDGEETCDADPCAVGRALEATGVDFTAHVIGFNVAEDDTAGMRCLAESTGGRFMLADDATELKSSFEDSVATTVEIAPIASSIKAPRAVNASASFDVEWTAPDAGAQFLLVIVGPSGADGDRSHSPVSLDGAPPVTSLTAPAEPGEYEIHLYSADNEKTATSPLTVSAVQGFAFAKIVIPNLQYEEVAVCAEESKCYNRTSDGWAGTISPGDLALDVPPGRYKLKFGSHFSQTLDAQGGQTIEYRLGEIGVPNLAAGEVAVCALDSECYNHTSDGWIGEMTPDQLSLQLPPGEYKLKVGSHVTSALIVESEQTTDLPFGRVSLPSATSGPVAVCAVESQCYNHTSDGWAGEITTEQPFLEVPPGSYKLKVGNHFSEPLTIAPDAAPSSSVSVGGAQTGDEKGVRSAAGRECAACPHMIELPGGAFVMGSPPDEAERSEDEGPQREVSIAAFSIGKYEVTRDEFAQFVAATSHDLGTCDLTNMDDAAALVSALLSGTLEADDDTFSEEDANWRHPGFEQGDGHPVVCVSFDDAKAYTAWLSEETGQLYALPTESQWEYAARAGTVSAYPWGDQIGEQNANCDGCADGIEETSAAGAFPPNAFGLHDMQGNVYEWVEDPYTDYSEAPSDGSASTVGDAAKRIIRGGSWESSGKYLRSAARWEIGRDARNVGIGFRVVKRP